MKKLIFVLLILNIKIVIGQTVSETYTLCINHFISTDIEIRKEMYPIKRFEHYKPKERYIIFVPDSIKLGKIPYNVLIVNDNGLDSLSELEGDVEYLEFSEIIHKGSDFLRISNMTTRITKRNFLPMILIAKCKCIPYDYTPRTNLWYRSMVINGENTYEIIYDSTTNEPKIKALYDYRLHR